jgi:proteasome beta subunit
LAETNDIKKMVLKGTTTIGIVCTDGVVLTTDTRATMGFFVAHKHVKKVHPIADHLAITIAGVMADAQNIVNTLQANARLFHLDKGRIMPVQAVARLAATILFSARGYPLIIQALIGGVDDSGTHIYSIDPLGSVTQENCVSTGSGSPIAYGVLEDGYREDLNVDAGVKLTVRAINSAMKRDAASGDSYDVVIVDKNGYRELSEAQKKAVFPVVLD